MVIHWRIESTRKGEVVREREETNEKLGSRGDVKDSQRILQPSFFWGGLPLFPFPTCLGINTRKREQRGEEGGVGRR